MRFDVRMRCECEFQFALPALIQRFHPSSSFPPFCDRSSTTVFESVFLLRSLCDLAECGARCRRLRRTNVLKKSSTIAPPCSRRWTTRARPTTTFHAPRSRVPPRRRKTKPITSNRESTGFRNRRARRRTSRTFPTVPTRRAARTSLAACCCHSRVRKTKLRTPWVAPRYGTVGPC